MGDHFAMMRDRLITEATLQVAIERMNLNESTCIVDVEPSAKEERESNCDGRLVQCRICHDEDLLCEMDVPCSCTGSLKYVHPRCVLKWCQEKGNTECEICLKQFRGYIIHRRIVLHMRDSIIRTNYDMQQRSANRRISTENSTERNPANNHHQHSNCFHVVSNWLKQPCDQCRCCQLVPLKIFVAALVSLLIIFFIAAPALQHLRRQQETIDPVAGRGLNV